MSEIQYGHEGRHHGIGTPECPTDLHHHHDDRCVSPLDARRQRARIAYYDACAVPDRREGSAIALEKSLATATRVRITPEIIEAFLGHAHPAPLRPNVIPALKAAFEAAGFEVEQ